ncbi:hypothetical protein PR048_000100 [Dryococelus australis]|uniref:Uncharacterized protein n=1 Tax=Dryococelus australis TaxID=614101 RepID=A0ABQ9IDP6_9NEOP|nr:hypothetical protein PR048_000100 [Dryococelus australis]
MKGRGNRRSPRRPADQQHRPARFPHAKDPELTTMELQILSVCILAVVSAGIHQVSGAKILALLTLTTRSHHVWNRELMMVLVSRGHEVIVVSPDVLKEPVTNLTYIHIEGSHEYMRVVNDWVLKLCDYQLSTDGAKQLFSYPDGKIFDLIIVESEYTDCFRPFITKFGNPPVIALNGAGIPRRVNYMAGSPKNPAYTPDYILPYSDKMDFLQRLESFITEIFGIFPVPSIEEYERNISIILANTVFGFDPPRPITPNVIPVGGMHLKPSGKLEKVRLAARDIVSGSILQPELNISLPLVISDTGPGLRHLVIRQYLGSPRSVALKLLVATSGVDVPSKWYQQSGSKTRGVVMYQRPYVQCDWPTYRGINYSVNFWGNNPSTGKDVIMSIYGKQRSHIAALPASRGEQPAVTGVALALILHDIRVRATHSSVSQAVDADHLGHRISASKGSIGLASASQLGGSLSPPLPLEEIGPKAGRSSGVDEGLQTFLDGAKDGAILFSLGSNLKSSLLPTHAVQSFLEAFAELPQRIVLTTLPDAVGNSEYVKSLTHRGPAQDGGGRQPVERIDGSCARRRGIPFGAGQSNANSADWLCVWCLVISAISLWGLMIIRTRKWRTAGECYNPNLAIEWCFSSKARIMVWGAMTYDSRSDLVTLRHKNIKLFITNNGLMSSQEAAYFGVPTLGIPFYFDQHKNSEQAYRLNIGVSLPFETLNKETLLASIKQILTNTSSELHKYSGVILGKHKGVWIVPGQTECLVLSMRVPVLGEGGALQMYHSGWDFGSGQYSYAENARRMSTVFRDQIDHPLDRAVFWIEYVLRHNGAPHLRSAAVGMPLYRYLLLDVLAVLLVMLVAVLLVLRAVARWMWRRLGVLRPSSTKTKTHVGSLLYSDELEFQMTCWCQTGILQVTCDDSRAGETQCLKSSGGRPEPAASMKLALICLQLVHGLEVYGDISGVEVYFDVYICSGRHEKERDTTLNKVLQKARRQYNIKSNGANIQYIQKKGLKCVGQVFFSKEGFKVDDAHVKAIRESEKPIDKKKPLRIMGLARFVDKFVPDVSTVTSPLRTFQKQNSEWEWNPEHENELPLTEAVLIKLKLQKYTQMFPKMVLEHFLLQEISSHCRVHGLNTHRNKAPGYSRKQISPDRIKESDTVSADLPQRGVVRNSGEGMLVLRCLKPEVKCLVVIKYKAGAVE